MSLRQVLKISSIFIGIFIVVWYGFNRSWDLIIGPQINIYSPKNGETLSDSFVNVEASAKNVSFISLNGRQIFADQNGKIEEQLLLSYGYNIITLSARDRFGRIVKKELQLIYQ